MDVDEIRHAKWESISAIVCIAALIVVVAIAQSWPAPSVDSNLNRSDSKLDNLILAWTRAPELKKLTKTQSFQASSHELRLLMIRGWLDKHSPKRFHDLTDRNREYAVEQTHRQLSADRFARR